MIVQTICGGGAILREAFVVVVLGCVFLSRLVSADLCLKLDDDYSSLTEYIHNAATPKGGQKAGVYTHGLVDGHNATTVTECLLSCCDTPTCNVIFFHKKRCYLIACDQQTPDSCDPVTHPNDKNMDHTYLIAVRSLDETAYLYQTPDDVDDDDGVPYVSRGDTSDEVPSCNLGDNLGCGEWEECKMIPSEGRIVYLCDCLPGVERDQETGECARRMGTLACEYGLDNECVDRETCTVKHSHSRSGQCECLSNYVRDEQSGLCVVPTATDSNDLKATMTAAIHKSTELGDIPTKSPDTKKSDLGSLLESSPPSSESEDDNAIPHSTTLPPLAPLVVSAGDNHEITLPNNEVTLDAFVIPSDDEAEYKYKWQLVTQPDTDDTSSVGDMVGMDTKSLKLSKLIAGLYTFKVVVTAEGKYGEAFVNVTVHTPTRINVPPSAVIKPPSQSVNQPNDVVLDGSVSTDDDKIVKYHWEQVSGPVESSGIDEKDVGKSILVLQGLKPGQYRYKLTVTDSDDVTSTTIANVTVIKETDYPPRANAGSNVIINLPKNSVTLYANASTDDKGIASYEWIKKSDDKLTADVKGVRTPVLHLDNLEEGDYTFKLKVTDTAGQVDTADIHVFVKAEHNKPPVARPGSNRTVWLPQDTVTLDATNSTDDQKITSYLWTQVKGPSSVTIENSDRAVATASKLVVGVYEFKVTVTDVEKLQGSASIYVTVKRNTNHAPVARAGGDLVITLPAPLVSLDGSRSTDDHGIVSYEWTREDTSLAAGDIVNNSDHQAVLQLTDLVAGHYVFILTVADDDDLVATDRASLTVNPVENREDLIELKLDTSLRSFTEANKKNLRNNLALLLHKNLPSVTVTIQELAEDKGSGNLIVYFSVSRALTQVNLPGGEVPGTLVASVLRDRLWADTGLLDFPVVSIDTLVCQNNCSSHGTCDQNTKRCVCEAFWMENPFQAYISGVSNCQWSILYVIILAFVSVVSFIGLTWATIFVIRRWYWTRPKKRHRYMLLGEADDADGDKDQTELVNKKDTTIRRKRSHVRTSPTFGDSKIGKVQSSSLMVSESDFTSDEETLFINKKANGHAGKNGFVRSAKNKVKA